MADRNMCKLPSLGLAPAGYKIWDEKGRSEIVQIIVTYDGRMVRSLQFLYSEGGNLVLSNVFGDNRGTGCFQVVKFNYPSEFITCVSGLYGGFSRGDSSVKSIKFTTNLGTYGPFGETSAVVLFGQGYRFSFGEERVFGGFHGFADPRGNGITLGVYLKLPTTLNVVDQNAVASSSRRRN